MLYQAQSSHAEAASLRVGEWSRAGAAGGLARCSEVLMYQPEGRSGAPGQRGALTAKQYFPSLQMKHLYPGWCPACGRRGGRRRTPSLRPALGATGTQTCADVLPAAGGAFKVEGQGGARRCQPVPVAWKEKEPGALSKLQFPAFWAPSALRRPLFPP